VRSEVAVAEAKALESLARNLGVMEKGVQGLDELPSDLFTISLRQITTLNNSQQEVHLENETLKQEIPEVTSCSHVPFKTATDSIECLRQGLPDASFQNSGFRHAATPKNSASVVMLPPDY
jgi:hypothetical protein